MKTKFFVLAICLLVLQAANAQTTNDPAKKPETTATPAPAVTTPSTPAANPADVASIDAIIKAVYDVISGDAGQARNWDRFRSLFHKDARMMAIGKNAKTGVFGGSAFTPEDYIKRADGILVKDGFHEVEAARRTETFGNIAHAFSTYTSKHKKSEEKPFMRGINSFQLLNDGTRWWIVSIYWQAESADAPLPEKYLKGIN